MDQNFSPKKPQFQEENFESPSKNNNNSNRKVLDVETTKSECATSQKCVSRCQAMSQKQILDQIWADKFLASQMQKIKEKL